MAEDTPTPGPPAHQTPQPINQGGPEKCTMGGGITAGKQDAEKCTYDYLVFIRDQFLIYTSGFKCQQGREAQNDACWVVNMGEGSPTVPIKRYKRGIAKKETDKWTT